MSDDCRKCCDMVKAADQCPHAPHAEVDLHPASLADALVAAATRRSIAYLGPNRDPLPEERMEIDAVYVDEVMQAVSQHHPSPAAPDENNLREAIARIMHGAYGSFAWESLDEDQQIPWLAIADAVLSSGLVVPVGEYEGMRRAFNRTHDEMERMKAHYAPIVEHWSTMEADRDAALAAVAYEKWACWDQAHYGACDQDPEDCPHCGSTHSVAYLRGHIRRVHGDVA